MANENCLAGMRCPECGSYGPFGISIMAWADDVTDDGVDGIVDIDWDRDAACACKACGYTETVGNFDEENYKGATE